MECLVKNKRSATAECSMFKLVELLIYPLILIVTNLHHTNIGYQSHQYKNLRKHIFLGKLQKSASIRLKVYFGPRLC